MRSAVSLLLFCWAWSAVCGLPLTWEQMTSLNQTNVPPPRKHHALGYLATSNIVIVFGGSGAAGVMNDTWLYQVTNRTWFKLGGRAPPARSFMVSGVIQELGWFVIAAGVNGDTSYNDVWVLNFNQSNLMNMMEPQWQQLQLTGEAPEVRYGGHGGVYPGTGMSFWLGFGFNTLEETGQRLGDSYRITFTNTSTLSEFYRWEKLHDGVGLNQYHPFLPHARCLESYAMTAEEQIVFHGGCLRGGVGGGPCPAEDAWVLSGDSRDWTELPRCVTPRAMGAMATLPQYPGSAVLYGGDDRFDNRILEQIIAGPRYPDYEVVVVNATTESWLRVRAEPLRRTDNVTNATIVEELPVRRRGHAMASGTFEEQILIMNNIMMQRIIRQPTVYMFGGEDIYNGGLLNDLWSLTGNVSQSEQLSEDCPAVWFSYLHLHGILLAVAWGLLFPTGVLVARYYRCGQSQTWLIIHVALQMTAVAMSCTGFVLAFLTSGSPNFPHAIIGIVLQMFGIQQPINGFLRPHKHDENKVTRNRQCWELWHKSTGYFTVLVGLVNVTLGVFLIIPPLAVWVVWLCAILIWVVVFVIYEVVHLMKVCECTGQAAAKDTEMNAIYPGY